MLGTWQRVKFLEIKKMRSQQNDDNLGETDLTQVLIYDEKEMISKRITKNERHSV